MRFRRGHFSAEVRAKISAAKLGHTVAAETRAKISSTLTGRTDDAATRAKKIASRNHGSKSETWKGEAVSYNGAHNRARKTLPSECAMRDDGRCKGRLEVAFRHDAPEDLVRYSDRLGSAHFGYPFFVGENSSQGYTRLCSRHHFEYDERTGLASS